MASPLKLPSTARSGQVLKASATGDFNIHGTTRRETIPLQLRLSGTSLEAAGSLTFPWGQFGMTAPSVAGFVNVTGKATMEFDLKLQRA